jgi:hypothetical protein
MENWTQAFQSTIFKSNKFQAPVSREASMINIQTSSPRFALEFEAWRFSGAWMLAFGAFVTLAATALRRHYFPQ